MKKILVISAHPDDEVLGCGGTVARFVKEGYEAFTLILGEGITSRDEKRDRKKRKKEIEKLKRQTLKANNILRVKDVFIHNFPDNRLDTVSLLDVVKVIENVKNKIKPDIVYTHYWGDLNIDHRITYNAVLAACRPIKKETVKEIYSFEVLSSTEWNYPNVFNPNTFVDIVETIDVKIEALRCYDVELRKFPYPRSLEGIKLNAKYWGMRVGIKYAEVFKNVRDIR